MAHCVVAAAELFLPPYKKYVYRKSPCAPSTALIFCSSDFGTLH